MIKLIFKFVLLLAILLYAECQTEEDEVIIPENASISETSIEKPELPEPEKLSPTVPTQESQPNGQTQVQVHVNPMPTSHLSNANYQFRPQVRVIPRGAPLPNNVPQRFAQYLAQPQHYFQLPPRSQPTYDSSLLCKQTDQNSKRDISKRSLYLQNLESFYMNPKNSDVMFSVCGTLFPAHLIIIESVSTKFENLISNLKNASPDNPITIESVDDLIHNNNSENPQSLKTTNCPDETLLNAFKIFLKYFYFDSVAFDDIQSLNVSFLVWKLGKEFLGNGTAPQEIEEKIASLMSVHDLNRVYQFVKENQIELLNKKWFEFIRNHANNIDQNDRLLLTCDEINGDIAYLDHYIEALNLNQSKALFYIRHYLQSCPQFANLTVSGKNLFPHSLLFFRCSVDDLKELRKMGFISYENLSEELENRLRALERQCSVKQLPPIPNTMAENFRRALMEGRQDPRTVPYDPRRKA